MTEVPARLAYFNIFARDIEGLSRFYSALFGFPEIVGHRSPIYRCLDAGGLELGFNAPQAYALLNVTPPESESSPPTTCYPTFEVGARETVEAIAEHARAMGGAVLKGPYETYYNAVQVVLRDPEGNLFRINHRLGPRKPADTLEAPPWAKAPDAPAP